MGEEMEVTEEYESVLQELEEVLGGKDKVLERQQSQISDSTSEAAGGDPGGSAARRRRVSTTSTGSGSKMPLLRRSASIQKKEDTPTKGRPSITLARERLIEAEKAETGSVKKDVYLHYFKAIGFPMGFLTILLNIIYQGFQVGSSVWLTKWSNDDELNDDGTFPTDKRNLYLGVYAALGLALGISVMIGKMIIFMILLILLNFTYFTCLRYCGHVFGHVKSSLCHA